MCVINVDLIEMTQLYLHCSSAAGSTLVLPHTFLQISDGAAQNARDPVAVGKQRHPKSGAFKEITAEIVASALIAMPTPR